MLTRTILRKYASATAATALAFLAGASARAQTACRTPNCSQTTPPAACQNRAAPRTVSVLMTGQLTYSPSEPKIEPGECVEWKTAALAHSSTADPCSSGLCGSPPAQACSWETGDVAAVDTPPSVICAYDPGTYPPETADGFYCRFHDTAAHAGTMHGILHVTTPIQLSVSKDALSGSIVLGWTGGGVVNDATYKVVRSDSGNPRFPVGETTIFDPNGGVAGTQFTDAGESAVPTARYYLVRNRQTNETSGSGCQPPNCDDLDPCTGDVCESGVCQHNPLPDGTPCDPVFGYVCVNGVCS